MSTTIHLPWTVPVTEGLRSACGAKNTAMATTNAEVTCGACKKTLKYKKKMVFEDVPRTKNDKDKASNARVARAIDIRRLNLRASREGFNRILSDEAISMLDPDGYSVLSMALWGHNVDTAKVLHHRIWAQLKFKDSDHPVQAMLDVADEDWKMLPTVGEAISLVGED